MLKKVESFRTRLRQAMDVRNVRARDLARKTGVLESTISQYLNGYAKPRDKRMEILADALGVQPAWLMGVNVPMDSNADVETKSFGNVREIAVDTLPVLGEIACGKPIIMNEEREYYTQSGTKIKADFILIASGDSMTGARINDGDLVFIRQQQTVENGEIAAVRIGDEATLKRFYKYPEKRMIILRAANPAYEDMVYMDEQTLDVEVIGKAVAFQSNVN